MKKFLLSLIALAFIIITTSVLMADEDPIEQQVEQQAEQQEKHIDVKDAYAFATSPVAKTGAVFLSITNNGKNDEALIGASSDVAEITEIHQNYIDPDDGMMMMRKVKEIKIPVSETVLLDPTGYHIMLIKLNAPLKMGEGFPVTLMFDSGYQTTIDTVITAPGQKPNKVMDHSNHVMPHETDTHKHQH